MADHPLDVVAINRRECYSMLRNQTICHWQRMFDINGDDTRDPDEAVSAVHPLPDGRWITLDLTEWETVTIH